MPDQFPSAHPYPGRHYRLGEAAADGQLIIVRCEGCKRSVRYLASDLVTLLDPKRYAHLPPFPCGRCGTADRMKVRFHAPSPGDYGHLVVRRPGAVKVTQMWRSVKLGASP